MGVPHSKPFRFAKTLNANASSLEHQSSGEVSSRRPDSRFRSLDVNPALAPVRAMIAAGDHGLDPILETIAEVAREMTAASGAALAMWKDSSMVCRARSGDMAPALGVTLTAKRGISGECLRSGKTKYCADTENDPLVDMEVCRNLGLRSIVVAPIHGWRGLNGILEVFSTRPGAFSEEHIALLQELAVLAERARASRPQDASPADRRLSARQS